MKGSESNYDQQSKMLCRLYQQDWLALSKEGVNKGFEVPSDADFLTCLFKVWFHSQYVLNFSRNYPRQFFELITSADLHIAYDIDEIKIKLRNQVGMVTTVDELKQTLRLFRHCELSRIAWRDILGWCPLEETMRDVSVLAQEISNQTLSWLYRKASEEQGLPIGENSGKPQNLVVFGMGKLGGFELNFSSDIDLVCFFPEEGVLHKNSQALFKTNGDFFLSLVQQFNHVIAAHTEDGFVYRVDFRLRPYGGSGPLVMSFDAAEEYFQSGASDWERYAWIKARPIAGDFKAGRQFLKSIRPFIFRRYIDYTAVEALHSLKKLIANDVIKKGHEQNVKRGPGGIREIEFIVQCFQLIHGGRKEKLQQPALLDVLKVISREEFLSADEITGLKAAYFFLRKVENRVQQWADQQTHELPEDKEDQKRLAGACGFSSWSLFIEHLDKYRVFVQTLFEGVISDTETQPEDSVATRLPDEILENIDNEEKLLPLMTDFFSSRGFNQAEESAAFFCNVMTGTSVRRISQKSKLRLYDLIPNIMMEITQQAQPDETLVRILSLLEVIVGRSAYLSLLGCNKGVTRRLVELCAKSLWVASLLKNNPVLFDDILVAFDRQKYLDKSWLQESLNSELLSTPNRDLETDMEGLRFFKNSCVLKIAVAELDKLITADDAEAILSNVADVCLEQSLMIAKGLVTEKGNSQADSFSVIAYGNLGSGQLNYSSDLDLIFLFHVNEKKREFDLGRISQKTISILNTFTPSGLLYEIDMRLRPNGSSGLLISDLDAFERYQLNSAMTWEHQALVRARFVSGSAQTKKRFESIRKKVLCKKRKDKQLKADVGEMLDLFHEHHLSKVPDDEKFDVKHHPGGLVDIEFMAQYLVLRWANKYPVFTDFVSTRDIFLQALSLKIWTKGDCEKLIRMDRDYRSKRHELSLQELPSTVKISVFKEYRSQVKQLWDKYLL